MKNRLKRRYFVQANWICVILVFYMFFNYQYRISQWKTNFLSINYLADVNASYFRGKLIPSTPTGHPRAHLWNATAAIHNENYEVAILQLAPLVETGDIYALGFTAWAYEMQGDYRDAIQIQKQLNNKQALYRICQITEQGEDIKTAVSACYAAWTMDFKPTTTMLAKLLIRDKNLANAEAVLRHSLSLTTSYEHRPFWLFILASVLQMQERWAESIEIQQQGINEQLLMDVDLESLAERYSTLAWAYHMAGQDISAVNTIEDAISALSTENDPSYDIVWWRAGKIYESVGLLSEAVKAYQYCQEQPKCRTDLDLLSNSNP